MLEREFIRAFRFGFGLARAQDFDPLQELAKQQKRADPTSGPVAMAKRFADLAEVQQEVKRSGRSIAAVEKEKILAAQLMQRDVHDAVVSAAQSPHMFSERLVLFWTNHFSLGTGNAVVARLAGPHAATVRGLMYGSFRQLLQGAVMNPAMMHYLNLQQAIGPNSPAGRKSQRGLNENLGREILELHSLGVDGGYDQLDVGALSRLLTGWRFVPATGAVEFRKQRAEPGSKRLLGRDIGAATPSAQDLQQAFDVLASHPSTARFVSKRLVLHFLGPGHESLVTGLAEVFQRTEGDLPSVYSALFEMSAVLPPRLTQFRNDAVFLVSALRALPLRDGVLGFELRDTGRPKANPATTGALGILRQKLWLANSPAGWPDEPGYWVAPSVMTARLRLIPRLVRLAQAKEPLVWAEQVLGPLLRPATRNAISIAPNRLQGMGLVLASPEFNRR